MLLVSDAQKKEKAVAAVADLCLHCTAHSDDCPLVKAIASVKAIPTE